MQSRFAATTIVIGDRLHRYNERSFSSSNPQIPDMNWKTEGQKLAAMYRSFIEPDATGNVTVMNWQDVSEKPGVKATKEKLQKALEKNKAFGRAVRAEALRFVDHKVATGAKLIISKSQAVNNSIKYIIEEMAVFSHLVAHGFPVQVYPGTQLQVLKSIASGDIQNVDTNLESGIYLDMIFKKLA